MRRISTWILPALLLLCSGCLQSLHPLFSEEDLVAVPELLGTWRNDENTWIFLPGEGKHLELICKEKQLASTFQVSLGRIGDTLFMDTYPGEPDCGIDYYQMHLVPGHMFSRVWLQGDSLRLAFLDPGWLEQQLEMNPGLIACEREKDMLILTASSAELQQFFAACSGNPDAFPDGSVVNLRRLEPSR